MSFRRGKIAPPVKRSDPAIPSLIAKSVGVAFFLIMWRDNRITLAGDVAQP
jgi:hypothetical protein